MLEVLQPPDAEPLRINTMSLTFFGYGAGLGGLLMVLAAFLPNWKAAVLMPAAALVAWLGPWLGVPDVGPLTAAQLSLAIGGVLGLLGLLLGRKS